MWPFQKISDANKTANAQYHILPIRGTKSIAAVSAVIRSLAGLMLLPLALQYKNTDGEDVFVNIQDQPKDKQRKICQDAVIYCPPDEEALQLLYTFVTDANNAPLTASNINGYGPDVLLAMLVDIYMEIINITVFF